MLVPAPALPGMDSTAAVHHSPGTPGTHWRTAAMWDDVLASLATVLVSPGSSVPARPWRTLTRLLFACATASYAAQAEATLHVSAVHAAHMHTQEMVAFDVPRDAGLDGKFAFRVAQIRVATQEA